MSTHITDVTRRRLIRDLAEIRWYGDLDEVSFLERIYDLDQLASGDSRFRTARQDIVQHCVANYDWPDDWIFTDDRFGLQADDTALIRFLVEMLHPAVRDDTEEVQRLVGLINGHLVKDGYELIQTDDISGSPIFEGRRAGAGVPGAMKNLIFAADGPKPDIVFSDALNNDIRVVRNEQYCLIYDRPLPSRGLRWADLTSWWAYREGLESASPLDIDRSLHQRLLRSLDNDAERSILHAYTKRYVRLGSEIPALIPQVYLHYDPYTSLSRAPRGLPLARQRMDFLLLLPQQTRIVIELDGKQHYAADDGLADPRRYAAMVAEDRELRLRGYEVYRFGGHEFQNRTVAEQNLSAFFDRLFDRHHAE